MRDLPHLRNSYGSGSSHFFIWPSLSDGWVTNQPLVGKYVVIILAILTASEVPLIQHIREVSRLMKTLILPGRPFIAEIAWKYFIPLVPILCSSAREFDS